MPELGSTIGRRTVLGAGRTLKRANIAANPANDCITPSRSPVIFTILDVRQVFYEGNICFPSHVCFNRQKYNIATGGIIVIFK